MQKIIATLIIASTLAACSSHVQQKPSATPNVNVSYPTKGVVEESYTYPAYLGANQQVALVARVSGTLEQINYPIGGKVSKGSALFVIEPQRYIDAVQSCKAQVQSTQAELAYAKSTYERMERSSKSNAVSQNELQQAQANYLQAQGALLQAESQLNEASLNLSYCYINAPFSGEVSKHTIDAGNYLNGGETLATIYDESILTVEFNMSYNEFAKIAQPLKQIKAYITIGSDTIPAQMQYVAPAVTLQTGTLAAQAIIDNKDYKLKSGVYVNITIPYNTNPDAVIVPESCVGRSLDKKFVYTLNADNTVSATPVTTGASLNGGMIEITSGLTHNQPYLVDALSAIRPGMKVNPIVK